jgi:glycosyltransferase involved in cell wall biosynthesis
MSAVYVACVFVFIIWTLISFQAYLALKRNRRLFQVAADPSEPKTLSVIIPARNEEDDITDALESVLAQQDIDLEVIAVNDHSKDRTGDIIDEFSRSDARVTPIHNPPLSEDWMGKCNAMQHGALSAKGQYLLFTDADIIFRPACFQTALSLMVRDSLDFLSLGPRFMIKPLGKYKSPHVFLWIGTIIFQFEVRRSGLTGCPGRRCIYANEAHRL